ncbi:MAG: choice-of-anchor B family protein [Phycisphaerales bacterium]
MSIPRMTPMVLAGLTAGAMVTISFSVAFAHPDDPKVRDMMPRYEGPGWRAADATSLGTTDGTSGPTGAASALAGGTPTFPAQGTLLRSWISIPEFGTDAAAGNDCWGWTSPGGREYALMGLTNATAFVDITDPGDPQIIDTIAGPTSSWRDIKTYDSFAYVVTEGSGAGVQIINMADLDNGNVALVNTISGPGGTTTHNVAIDTDSGYLYRCGGQFAGLRIYSLDIPAAPVFVGEWTTKYIHDLQVVTYDSGPFAGREIAYMCTGFNSGFVDPGLTVLDVTDKSNPVVIDEFIYPQGGYSHQAWLSEDRQYLYLNDELDEDDFNLETTIHVFNVGDPANVDYLGTFGNGNAAVGHNLYIRDEMLFSANYRSGLRIFDLAADPVTPPEIAFFDTFPANDATFFNGAWSVYPFFESGTVIISDIERGLFVIEIDEPLVSVNYVDGQPDLLAPDGELIRVDVTEEQPGALGGASVRIVTTDAATGVPVTTPMTEASPGVFEAMTPLAECFGEVDWYIEFESADGEIQRDPPTAPADQWRASVGTAFDTKFDDDAETPAGWTVFSDDLTGGEWERGVPAGDGSRGDPVDDFDGSGACWLTENDGGNTDVDGGPTVLTSRVFDLAGEEAAILTYAAWFTNNTLDGDRLRVEVSSDDGATWTEARAYADSTSWRADSFRIDAFSALTATMRVRFVVSDNPNDSVTEAAVDAIQLLTVVCESTGIPGDVNGDGAVDFSDLLSVLAAFGPCPGGGAPCPADVDDNGSVEFSDVLAVLSAWTG